MATLIECVVILIVLALALYGIDLLGFGDPRVTQILKAVLVLIAIVALLSRSGLVP